MRKYISPKIKAINLNPEQALLQVCQVGGIYVENGLTNLCAGTKGTTGAMCNKTVRGVSNGLISNFQSYAPPS